MTDKKDLNQDYMGDEIVQELIDAGVIDDKANWESQLQTHAGNSDCLESDSVRLAPGLAGESDLQDKFCAPLESLTGIFGVGGRRRRRRRRKSRKSRKSRRKSRKTKRKRRKSRKTKKRRKRRR